ncbi:TPA: hypothetical protein N0F65_010036 [Lagenidium giganteum]|uniref:AB hydrolase-1 domain-containing protein n=1 Tax=Lagenidium giganteum TaxID=4803 RepID=A0AAV2ZEW8_9STRA|nr:TPA: hypothetical protein N0F65_010036 [Lagenidium giganteum]
MRASDAMGPGSTPSPSATAGTDKLGVHQRMRAARVLPVLLLILLLTPFWILYGCVGYVLTRPSSVLSRRGVMALGCAMALVGIEIAIINHKAGHSVLAVPSSTTVGLMASFAIALLVAQFEVHRIVMVCVDASRGSIKRQITLFEGLGLACALGWVAWFWESVYALNRWAFASSFLLYIVTGCYLALPLVIAMSHAQLWIPARYEALERVEHQILSKIVKCPFQMMKIAGLGTVYVPTTKSKTDNRPVQTIVLIHGFAAGNALWACNLEFLAQYYDVYAVEWVGAGRSDRPTFESYSQEEADRIIVDALEEWRAELKAMFATSFAARYPGHVEHLVLVSPAGVGYPPERDPSKPLPIVIRIVRRLWRLRLTPMSVVRFAGPLGPLVLRMIVSARVSLMPETSCVRRGDLEFEALTKYWYHNWALKASGEVAMHTHLLPGAYAKKPLCELLTPERFQIPITFMYGGGPDWMESSHADKVAEKFKGYPNTVRVLHVPLAGHQVFMDNLNDQVPVQRTGVVLIAGMATHGRCWEWVPASYDRLEQSERRILEKNVRTPFEMTKVAGLGTVHVPCSDPIKRQSGKVQDIVMIHGFAGGNAFWARNLEDLSKHFNVYAVEWIGVGRSDRPDFEHKEFDAADDFIVGSFEKWRKELELTNFHLCAHSMGAIFASSYALQFPENVDHLVLVSPAGVSRPPPPPPADSPEAQAQNKSWLRRMIFSAWENGVTPMSVARFVGPYGPTLVQNVLQRRISFMPQTSAMRDGTMDLDDLAEYIYHNWALKASGEKAMMTHLAPGALARRPLIDMLLPERVKMPVTFIYGGESDWMDYRHGLRVVKNLVDENKQASLHLVPYSGHQVFLDNPAVFNRTVIEALVK